MDMSHLSKAAPFNDCIRAEARDDAWKQQGYHLQLQGC